MCVCGAYMCVYVCIYMYVSMLVCMYVCMYICMHVLHVCVCMHVCMYAYIHVSMYVCVCVLGYRIQDVKSKYNQNWINHLERMDNTRHPKHALNYKPTGRRDRGRPGNDGKASMPEQVRWPNAWRKMMMMITYVLFYFCSQEPRQSWQFCLSSDVNSNLEKQKKISPISHFTIRCALCLLNVKRSSSTEADSWSTVQRSGDCRQTGYCLQTDHNTTHM